MGPTTRARCGLHLVCHLGKRFHHIIFSLQIENYFSIEWFRFLSCFPFSFAALNQSAAWLALECHQHVEKKENKINSFTQITLSSMLNEHSEKKEITHTRVHKQYARGWINTKNCDVFRFLLYSFHLQFTQLDTSYRYKHICWCQEQNHKAIVYLLLRVVFIMLCSVRLTCIYGMPNTAYDDLLNVPCKHIKLRGIILYSVNDIKPPHHSGTRVTSDVVAVSWTKL